MDHKMNKKGRPGTYRRGEK